MADRIVTANDIFEAILFYSRIGGSHPYKNLLFFELLWSLAVALNITWTILLIIKLIYSPETAEYAATAFVNFAMLSQVAFKAVHTKLFVRKLSKLLHTIDHHFWKSNEIETSKKKFDVAHKIILRSIKTYNATILVCCSLIFMTPVLLSVKKLPFELSFFQYNQLVYENDYIYGSLYLGQCFSVVMSVFSLLSFDTMFMAMIGCGLVQIDMLKMKLMMIGDAPDYDTAFKRLREAVQHHNIVLKFLQQVESYFTITILKQFSDSVFIAGVHVYLIQQEFHLVHLFTLFTNMTQSFLFSLGGQLIQDQSRSIADAAFECGWENIRDRKIRKELTFIMQRSQRKVQITAGGVMDLSFTTFLAMLKAAFSFLAVLSSTNRSTN